jgi:hypothetical protein
MTKRHDKRSTRPILGLQTGQAAPTRSEVVVIADLLEYDEWRRYEFGVEALCELACDILSSLTDSAEIDQATCRRVSDSFARRFSGINLAVANPQLALSMEGWVAPVSVGKLLWLSLKRVMEFSELLADKEPTGQWRQIYDIIEAWRDAWGDDKRACMAQARFSTLTGITRGRQSKLRYMHDALIKALSVVQA